MKSLHTHNRPFVERPYYTSRQIDRICLEELQAVDLYPASPQPIRIERFIEKRFKLSVVYDDLPPSVLGYTSMGPRGVVSIVVSRSLCSEGSAVAERRVNTTLAHEAGHGLLHGHLFALEAPGNLFGAGSDVDEGRILCRDDRKPSRAVGKAQKYDGRWWELQANHAIGGLLLPVLLVQKCVERFLIVRGGLDQKVLLEEHRQEAIRHIADAFDVNPIVARIRLDAMYSGKEAQQMTL